MYPSSAALLTTASSEMMVGCGVLFTGVLMETAVGTTVGAMYVTVSANVGIMTGKSSGISGFVSSVKISSPSGNVSPSLSARRGFVPYNASSASPRSSPSLSPLRGLRPAVISSPSVSPSSSVSTRFGSVS